MNSTTRQFLPADDRARNCWRNTTTWFWLPGWILLVSLIFNGCRGKQEQPQPTPDVAHSHGSETTSEAAKKRQSAGTGVAEPDLAPSQQAVQATPGESGTQPVSDSNNGSEADVQEHPRMSEFTEAQLSKHHTLFVLAFDSITRHTYFLSNYGYLMEEHQIELTRDLIDSFDDEYDKLRNRRAEILENAQDGQNVSMLLKNLDVETLLLSREVRRQIYRTILTPEQKQEHQEAVKERKETQKRREQFRAEEKQKQIDARQQAVDSGSGDGSEQR